MLYWFKTGFNLDFAVTEPFTLMTGAATDGKSPAVFRGGIVQLDPVGIQTRPHPRSYWHWTLETHWFSNHFPESNLKKHSTR